MKISLSEQDAIKWFKIFLISSFATIVDFLILWLSQDVGLSLFISATIGFLAGNLVVYLLFSLYIVSSRPMWRAPYEVLAFFSVGAVALMLNYAIIAFSTQAGFSLLVAKFLSAVILFLVTNSLRLWLFGLSRKTR